MNLNLAMITENKHFKRLVSDKIISLTVSKKIGFLAKMTQLLALVAIGAGLVGMILSNNSINTMYSHSIQPLDELRAAKYAIEYDVIQVAKDLKEGKMTSDDAAGQTIDAIYDKAMKRIIKAEITAQTNWGAYTSSKELTAAEQQKLPFINESIGKAFESIMTLKEIVKAKDLPALIDFVESEMPFMLSNMTPLLDGLMQIQVERAQELYNMSQIAFGNSFIITVIIYLVGALFVILIVKVISDNILEAVSKLIKESELIAANKLDEPFIWERTDELGKLGNSFERTRKELSNLFHEIHESHEEISRAHENICSSINYARRIQLAFLPDEVHLKDSVNDFFIIWRPKDVIGGDCYWMERVENKGCFIAAIDCTGHGVPGALMTFVVLSLLSRILAHEELHHEPALVLGMLNKLIKDELGQHDSSSESNDGMDGAFIFINGTTVTYSAANIPLMYYRPGSDEIEELKADKTSIGYVHSNYDFEFKSQTVEFEKGTRLYLITDGITDQIGGDRQLSFGKKRSKKILMESMHLSMEQQKEYLWEKFVEYKGTQTQRDDNTMIGIEI